MFAAKPQFLARCLQRRAKSQYWGFRQKKFGFCPKGTASLKELYFFKYTPLVYDLALFLYHFFMNDSIKFNKPKKFVSRYEDKAGSYWFEKIKRIYEKSGKIPSKLDIISLNIIDKIGIPYGENFSFEFGEDGKRINSETYKIISEKLFEKLPILINKEEKLFSSDFRDLYPEGFPRELRSALNGQDLEIMDIEYEHKNKFEKLPIFIKRFFEKVIYGKPVEDFYDTPVNYFRLTGGVGLFLKGFIHNKRWCFNHIKFLKEMNKHAKVICVESFADVPLGESLDRFFLPDYDFDYGFLVKETIASGFDGYFSEIDERDSSKIDIDNVGGVFFPELPKSFYENYFSFFKRYDPEAAKIIKSPENLEKMLYFYSTTDFSIKKYFFGLDKDPQVIVKGKIFSRPFYFPEDSSLKEKHSLDPVFLELGLMLVSDAIAAIKLHLVAKLMADGYIKKGPIIDYIGNMHLYGRSFFLKYPLYAMRVALWGLPYLMASEIKEANNIEEINDFMKNPDFEKLVKKITRLIFGKFNSSKNEFFKEDINFLEVYKIDPSKIIPTDDEIIKVQEKFQKNIRT